MVRPKYMHVLRTTSSQTLTMWCGRVVPAGLTRDFNDERTWYASVNKGGLDGPSWPARWCPACNDAGRFALGTPTLGEI